MGGDGVTRRRWGTVMTDDSGNAEERGPEHADDETLDRPLPEAVRTQIRVLDIHEMVIEDDGWDEASFPFLELPDVETVVFAPWQSGHTIRSLDNTRFDERRLRTLHLKYHNGRDCTFDKRIDVTKFAYDGQSRSRTA